MSEAHWIHQPRAAASKAIGNTAIGGINSGIIFMMPKSPTFFWPYSRFLSPSIPLCCGVITRSPNELMSRAAVTSPVIQRPDGGATRSSLTIDNYGKTPAFVTHVDIGYWWLRHG